MALKGYNLNGIDIPVFPADSLETGVNGRMYFNSTSKVVRIYRDGAWHDLITATSDVSSLNSLTGAINLVAGSGISVTPSGQNITIANTQTAGANTTLSNLTAPVELNQPFNDSNGIESADFSSTFDRFIFNLDGNPGIHIKRFVALTTDDQGVSSSSQITATTGNTTGDQANTGLISLITGNALSGGSGGLNLFTGTSGDSTLGASTSGALSLTSGDSSGVSNSGQGFLRTGNASTGSTGSLDMTTGGVTGVGATGNTGGVNLVTGSITDAGSTGIVGDIVLETGDNAGSGVSGNVTAFSGSITNPTSTSATGIVGFGSGQNDGLGETGQVTILSGDNTNAAFAGTTGSVGMVTGNNAGSGNSGNIVLLTGAVVSGLRGAVTIDALYLGCPRAAANPTGTTGGQVYYNTGTNKLKVFNGTTWETITSV